MFNYSSYTGSCQHNTTRGKHYAMEQGEIKAHINTIYACRHALYMHQSGSDQIKTII